MTLFGVDLTGVLLALVLGGPVIGALWWMSRKDQDFSPREELAIGGPLKTKALLIYPPAVLIAVMVVLYLTGI